MLADITSRDSDGELIAIPAEWDEVEGGEPPKIRIHNLRRPQPGAAAGIGDRALLRVEKLEEHGREGTIYRGRIIKIIDHAKRYAEGTAVRLEVHTAQDANVVKTLAKIKIEN